MCPFGRFVVIPFKELFHLISDIFLLYRKPWLLQRQTVKTSRNIISRLVKRNKNFGTVECIVPLKKNDVI